MPPHRQALSLAVQISISRTGCGFIFVPLVADKASYWENALLNFTEIYKYKRSLNKCLGVVAFKTGDYFDLHWAYIQSDWQYNEELEVAVKQSDEFYAKGEFKEVDRYKFRE